MFCVYKHTAPNGKVYIGITSKNPLDRWKNGSGYKNNKHFCNAIVKFGWNNLKHEILYSNLTKEEACKKEIELIALYKSNVYKYGYNSSSGGELSGKGSKRTDAQKRKTSQSLMHHAVSEETKEKIRAARKKQTYFGIRKGKCGSANPKSKAVAQYDQNGNMIMVYETVSQAAKANNVCHQSISDCCKGKLKTVKGFIFSYKEVR